MQDYFLFLNLSLLCACFDSKDEEVDITEPEDTDGIEDTDDAEDTDDTEDTEIQKTDDTEDADCIEIDLETATGDAVATGDASNADNTYIGCGEVESR